MKSIVSILALTALLSLNAIAQEAATTPILDGYPVTVESVQINVNGARKAEQLMASVSYYAGCGKAQALVVTGNYPTYSVVVADGLKRDGLIHCQAVIPMTQAVLVDSYSGPSRDTSIVTVNGIKVSTVK
jgi:hypothetical protein